MDQINGFNHSYSIQVNDFQMYPLNCIDCISIQIKLGELASGKSVDPIVYSGFEGITFNVKEQTAFFAAKPK